jgi:threonyl-tRNA synthetase
LIGIPVRLVVSDKTVAEDKVEVKFRLENESKLLTVEEAIKKL